MAVTGATTFPVESTDPKPVAKAIIVPPVIAPAVSGYNPGSAVTTETV